MPHIDTASAMLPQGHSQNSLTLTESTSTRYLYITFL